MKIPQSEWKWYGSPGHLIVAQWCRFHLCTEIGDYLVSTVGMYVHPRHSQGSEATDHEWWQKNWPGEDIGCGRKFETAVFRATGDRCTSATCGCGLPVIDCEDLDILPANTATAARANHMQACAGVASGEIPCNQGGEE